MPKMFHIKYICNLHPTESISCISKRKVVIMSIFCMLNFVGFAKHILRTHCSLNIRILAFQNWASDYAMTFNFHLIQCCRSKEKTFKNSQLAICLLTIAQILLQNNNYAECTLKRSNFMVLQ